VPAAVSFTENVTGSLLKNTFGVFQRAVKNRVKTYRMQSRKGGGIIIRFFVGNNRKVFVSRRENNGDNLVLCGDPGGQIIAAPIYFNDQPVVSIIIVQ